MPPEDLTFRRLRTYAWESGVYLQRNTRKATGSPHAHMHAHFSTHTKAHFPCLLPFAFLATLYVRKFHLSNIRYEYLVID